MTEQRRREIQNFIECGNATDQAPSILDAEFPETVWDWGRHEIVGEEELPGIPEGSYTVYPSLETAILAGAPDPHEWPFQEVLDEAFSIGDDWVVILDENDNEIARYPTR